MTLEVCVEKRGSMRKGNKVRKEGKKEEEAAWERPGVVSEGVLGPLLPGTVSHCWS